MYIPYPACPGDRVRFRTIAGRFEATVGSTGRTLREIELIKPSRQPSSALTAYLNEGRLVPQLIAGFEIVARPKN